MESSSGGGQSGSITRREYLAGTAAVLAASALAGSAAGAQEARAASISRAGRVLIIIGDGTETVDTLYPFYRLQEDDFVPVVAGPERKRYHMVLHEQPADWEVTREFEGYTLQAEVSFREVKPEEYVGIFFSGGRAPEYLRYDEDLMRITRHFFETNKPVGCVCHGVEIPARAGVLNGRRMATVPKCRFDLEAVGGIFVNEPCVVDGNLVSGRTFHDHGKYMGKWMALLRAAREKAK